MFHRTFSLFLLLGIALLAGSKLNAQGTPASPPAGPAGVPASPSQSQAGYQTIHNDFFWVDQDGNHINTSCGCLRQFNNLFYWYGMTNRAYDQTCYVSSDLVHWTYKGVALHTDTDANRMDVLYNDSTKKYVMFLKYQGNSAFLGIATADKPEGPYTFKSQTLVDGAKIGDMSMYEDTDGRAYLCYVWWNKGPNRQHGIYRMSADYLTLDKRMYLFDIPSREAPFIFKRNKIYYYGTSRTAMITSTATNLYTATDLAGPWSPPKVLSTPGSNNSWDTQCDFVYDFHGTQGTTYMYDGDRYIKTALRRGDFLWLPLEFDGDTPIMNYYQDWDINPSAGTWRKFDPARNLALNKTATASSATDPNVAANVTAPTTYLNYVNFRWESAAGDPQWIMVDLGAPQPINRVILKWHANAAKEFKIQTSTDAAAWTDVFSTSLGAAYTVTDETFKTTTARYVRMYGTRRVPQTGTGRGGAKRAPPPGTQPSTPAGYSLFSFMVLKD
jgi:hypothetical protein